MLDIKFIRENPELVKKAVRDKGMTADIDRLLILDAALRRGAAECEDLRARRNALAKRAAMGQGKDEAASQVRELKEKISAAMRFS